MKKLFFVFVMLLVGSIVSNTYAIEIAKQWERVYISGSFLDDAYSIQQTMDGGYIVAGTAGFLAYRILKLNSNGDIIWEKIYETYGGAALSIQQTTDGGYIVAGWFGLPATLDILVLKLNSNGDIVWQKTYGGNGEDGNVSIRQTSDGGYIMAGTTSSFGVGGQDVWVLKLDSEGNTVWQKTYGGSYDDAYTQSEWSCSIQETSDGGYIVSGATISFGAGNLDAWVLKLDSVGNVTWQKTYGGSGPDYAYSIQQTTDGGYIVAGKTNSFGVGDSDAWVLKLDGVGNITWQKTFGTPDPWYTQDEATSIQQTADGGYIVSCGFDRKLHVLKLDSNGNISWGNIYSEFLSGVLPTIQQVIDGGYIVASMGSHGGVYYDFWVLKLATNGEIPGCDLMGTIDISVSDTSVTGQDSDATISSTNATINTPDIIIEDISSVVSPLCTYNDPSDTDADGVSNTPVTSVSSSRISEGTFLADEDNCPEMPNGSYLGTCIEGTIGEPCICDEACGEGGVCSMSQEDIDGDGVGDVCDNCQEISSPNQDDNYPPGGNGCGDVCDCEGNIHPIGAPDGDVDGSDAYLLKLDFGRGNCNEAPFCNGDFECDNDCDGSDAYLFKTDFGRVNCPACTTSTSWCSY